MLLRVVEGEESIDSNPEVGDRDVFCSASGYLWCAQREEFISRDVGRRALVARSDGSNVEDEILGFRDDV